MKRITGLFLITMVLAVFSGSVIAKPLKVYILSGQSNMEGAAKVETFDYIGDDPATAPMLKEMRGPDGKPRVCDKVWISYFTGWKTLGEGFGKLTSGYGSRSNPAEDGGKIGPEFTFGIYMQKFTNEPILIIKTAWGGKSLHTDFRPPSAGPYKLNAYQQKLYTEHPGAHGVPKDLDKWKADKVKATGKYYRLMMDHVKMVLADIKRVCPVYDEKEGYELAGFAWFQGWNDMCDSHTYPQGHKGPDGYAEYTNLMAHFIRDVRKDLSAPKMPFVIGVIGVGGDKVKGGIANLRPAMAAPAMMDEFKGNVAAVETAPYFDLEMEALESRLWVKNLMSEDVKIIVKDGFVEKSQAGVPGWEPIGKTKPADRVWRFISFDPQKKADALVKTEKKRFRDVALPAGLENWNKPAFDDSKWKSGKTPVGIGDWPLGYFKDVKVKSRSDWGSGEFLLMRNTFEVDNLDYESYRISILARQGYHVYLNGHKIHTYIWWKDAPHYQSIVLRHEQARHLKKGVNVLAVYANVEYDRRTQVPHAAIDLCIEGITKDAKKYVSSKKNIERKVDKKMSMVFTPREKSVLKGCSNAGYHYMGSAKTMGLIGKALAEAIIELEKK